jgi:hypothetical protein
MSTFLLLVSLNMKNILKLHALTSRAEVFVPPSASPYSCVQHLAFVFPFSVLYARLRLRPKLLLEYCKEY